MKDESRQPTKLERLRELAGLFEINPDAQIDALEWLQWTYNFLEARKMYHKKARITQAMLVKMSKTLLSKDELEQIEREAEAQLVDLPDEQIPMELMEKEGE
jgi:hypothetical protein